MPLSIDTVPLDQLITLARACEKLPRSNRGKKVSLVTLWRWRTAKTGARLETVTVGGTIYTTEAAIRDFIRARTAERTATAPPPATGTVEVRRRRVERGLRRHGITAKPR